MGNAKYPVTVMEGANTLVECAPERIVSETLATLNGKDMGGWIPVM